MEENTRLNGEIDGHWAAVVRAYCELMDEVVPYLPPAEQSLYQRLFRLSHVQQSPFTKCRYAGRAVWFVAEYCPAGSKRIENKKTHQNRLGK